MNTRRASFMIMAALCSTLLGQSKSMAADQRVHPVLAELFTSQSCSSCPPADALLGDLAKRPDILALSFHVDYWDGAGWNDPFSLHAATTRQRQYAELLGTQVYTPQLVVGGRSEAVGSDRRGVDALLQRSRAGVAAATIQQSNGHLDIHIDGSGAPTTKLAADILLVTFDPVHKTPIRGGENGGRFLLTYNDVRSLRAIGRWRGEPVSMAVTPSDGEIGERAAIIVQSSDGQIWALAATKAGAAE
jgi:hypothetical protein